jgi:DNA sulfur modification protein DndD
MLEKAPSDEILNPIINDINLLNRDYGELNKEIERMDEEIRINSFRLDEIKRKLQKSQDEKYNESAFDRRLKLLKSVQVTLKDFTMVLRMEKTKMISENFVECMNLLLNKEDFISNISIDPESYSINLSRSNRAQINKDDLSAGEKQIYAIAMLMSLAKISGFPLPFIIDTPLARLDSFHRQNIVTRFFPYASHQVIIFSTDTEIDKIYFDELIPFLSKAYHLSYDSTSSSTKVEEGYFWKKEAVNYEFSKD